MSDLIEIPQLIQALYLLTLSFSSLFTVHYTKKYAAPLVASDLSIRNKPLKSTAISFIFLQQRKLWSSVEDCCKHNQCGYFPAT
jgi:hypothetical protein